MMYHHDNHHNNHHHHHHQERMGQSEISINNESPSRTSKRQQSQTSKNKKIPKIRLKYHQSTFSFLLLAISFCPQSSTSFTSTIPLTTTIPQQLQLHSRTSSAVISSRIHTNRHLIGKVSIHLQNISSQSRKQIRYPSNARSASVSVSRLTTSSNDDEEVVRTFYFHRMK